MINSESQNKSKIFQTIMFAMIIVLFILVQRKKSVIQRKLLKKNLSINYRATKFVFKCYCCNMLCNNNLCKHLKVMFSFYLCVFAKTKNSNKIFLKSVLKGICLTCVDLIKIDNFPYHLEIFPFIFHYLKLL